MGRQLRSVTQQPSGRATTASNCSVIQYRATMTSLGDSGRSPGHYALFEAIRYKRHRQALLLTEAGADVNCRNDKGQTPLIFTALIVDDSRSRNKLTRLFLDAEADPNLTDWQGMTVLMHASILGQIEVIKPLLECKWTNPGLKDPDGNTALMYAASIGHSDVISTFINVFRHDIGYLKLSEKNSQGYTALHLAARNGHDICARLLTRDAQLFPNAIEAFPDPKDLEREPTPCEVVIDDTRDKKAKGSDIESNGRISSSSKNAVKNRSGTERFNRATDTSILNFSINGTNQSNTCNNPPSKTDCEELEDQCFIKGETLLTKLTPRPTETTKSVSSLKQQVASNTVANNKNMQETKGVFNEMTQTMADMWPALPTKALPPKCTKVLQPLIHIENSSLTSTFSLNNNLANAKHWVVNDIFPFGNRKIRESHCIRSFSGPGGKASEAWVDADRVQNSLQKDHTISKMAKNDQNCGNRQESMSSLLPIISCSKEGSPLPPVKNILNSCMSKKGSIYVPNSSLLNVRGELPSGEIEIFKKNIFVRS